MKFDVLPSETSFLVSVDPSDTDRAVFLQNEDPDGTTVFDVGEAFDVGLNKTGGMYTLHSVALNWPVDDSDAPLIDGRWRTDVGTVDINGDFATSVPIQTEVAFKVDPDLANGSINARIVTVGSIADDAEVSRATQAAAAIWQDIYSDFGLDVTVRYDTHPYDEPVNAPGQGSGDLIVEISGASDRREVTIMIVDRVAGEAGVQGFAGAVPGMMIPSSRSTIMVSAIDHGGTNLEFSPAEVRLLGETFAHETGHWLGVFHPVELDLDQWDALEDTEQCTLASTCQAALGTNLMYPEAQCDGTTCTPQGELTEDQQSVLHRSVWVD